MGLMVEDAIIWKETESQGKEVVVFFMWMTS